MTVFATVVWPTGCVPKARLAGLNESGRMPLPESAAVWGESGALSLTMREPVRAPAIAGVKVTLTVQNEPELRELPQVLLNTEKFPVVTMELIFTLVAPVFVSLIAFEALVVPTG